MLKQAAKVRWENTFFLTTTLLLTCTVVPYHIWTNGIDLFQVALFLFFFFSTGMSITLGYHRLFSHMTFQARWPVKLYTLLFGAAAFEGSALAWSADHRRHHKHVDHEEDDPYAISKGFFHAHIGWLIFRRGPETPLTWVRDLQKDKLVWWQHKNYLRIAFPMSFALPALIGYAWGGGPAALSAFLISGIARVVCVHHSTFCINSLCHWIGSRPYSTRCSARDSFFMALFTFGEGYHNFHHEFQYDYRNGVKPWQYDPTKWAIWFCSKIGLTKKLRTVPEEVILNAQIAEQKRHMEELLLAKQTPISESVQALIHSAQERLHEAVAHWETRLSEYRAAAERRSEISRRQLRDLKREVNDAASSLRVALRHWMETHQVVATGLPSM